MDDRHLGYTKNIQTFDRKLLPEEKLSPPCPSSSSFGNLATTKFADREEGFCDPRENPSRNCSKVLHFRASSPSSHYSFNLVPVLEGEILVNNF